MKKFKNNKGFTLMEMLIVVAIIAILIAIAIPAFTTQLEKARETADIANIRSAYAEAMTKYLSGDADPSATTAEMTQTGEGWKYVTWPDYLDTRSDAKKNSDECQPTAGQKVTITINTNGDGDICVDCGAPFTE